MECAIDISVIIVNWNTRELLLQCVKSLYATTHESCIEIIVVDNNSSDGSVQALSEQYPNVVRIVNSDNVGFSKANNQGMQVAKGRYLCLVNSDVKALDGVLDRLRACLESRSDVGAVGPRAVDPDLTLQPNCREYPSIRSELCQALLLDRLFPGVRIFRGQAPWAYSYSSPREVDILSGCFLMVRSEVFRDVGGLDERFFIYGEDVDWCRRIRSSGWRVLYFPEAQAVHYGGASSAADRTRFNVEMKKAQIQYWRKYGGRLRACLFVCIQVIRCGVRVIGWYLRILISCRSWRTGLIQAGGYWRVLAWLARKGWRQAVA